MKELIPEGQKKRRVAIEAALVFVVVLLITQMWLLTATLESYLAGHTDVALPGLLASTVLFLACFAIYRLVTRLDRAPDRQEEPHEYGPWEIH